LGTWCRRSASPFTEVGALRIDGDAVGPARQPSPGVVVEIDSVQRPQPAPGATGFLLDVGLGTLARRLRILGVDAAYRNDADDDALVAEGTEQHRVVLTQDRGLLKRRALWVGAYVQVRARST
jgi:hypothetical protein